MPGASDQVRDDEVPIPCLHATSPFWPSAHAAVTSPADSDDEVPIPISHTALLWFRVMVMLRVLSCASVFLVFALPPPILLCDSKTAPQAGGRGECPLGQAWGGLIPTHRCQDRIWKSGGEVGDGAGK
jgi:hypothetical protein